MNYDKHHDRALVGSQLSAHRPTAMARHFGLREIFRVRCIPDLGRYLGMLTAISMNHLMPFALKQH